MVSGHTTKALSAEYNSHQLKYRLKLGQHQILHQWGVHLGKLQVAIQYPFLHDCVPGFVVMSFELTVFQPVPSETQNNVKLSL